MQEKTRLMHDCFFSWIGTSLVCVDVVKMIYFTVAKWVNIYWVVSAPTEVAPEPCDEKPCDEKPCV